MADPTNNGDRHFHEPAERDSAVVKALKADWNRIADKVLERAHLTAQQWQGKAWASQRRVNELRKERHRIEAAERALRGEAPIREESDA